MGIKYFNLRVPHGMALQGYNDGTYNLVYDETKIVQLRDWFASLTNTLTDEAVSHLERQKADEERQHRERAERARNLAFPVSRAAGIEKEKQRVNSHIAMMGREPTPVGKVLDKPTTLKPPKSPLVVSNPNRVVNTDQGPIEVASDVTDAEIRALGYTIEGDDQIADVKSDTNTTGTEHSNSPVEDVS